MKPLAECHGAMATAIMLSICIAIPPVLIQKHRGAPPFESRYTVKRVYTQKIEPPKPHQDRIAQERDGQARLR
jgi:hypothetical protein